MTESPFLDGTNIQFAYDSTMLGDLKKCPQYYYLTHICGWVPADEDEHIRFGHEYHQAMQNYDISIAAGIKPDDAIFDVVAEMLRATVDWDSTHHTKNRRNLVRSAIWHMVKYRDDPAQTIIKSDGTPAVELSFRFELDFGPTAGTPYILCGHMDRAANYNGGVFIVDYKTTTYAPTPWYFHRYDRDNQMTFYTLAGQIVLNQPIRGVMIDAVKVAEDESVFGRGLTHRPKEVVNEWVEELAYWFALQQQYAEADRWPHNDTACDKYGGCRFKSVCNTPRSLRQQYLEANFRQVPKEDRWNPLKSR